MSRTVCFLAAASLAVLSATAQGDTSSQSQVAPAASVTRVEMTEELMSRLIKFARGLKGTGSVTAKICAIFELCDGSRDMPLKLLETERPEGVFFGLPLDKDSPDILVMSRHDGIVEAYLTDRSGKLRAAAVADGKPAAHLITNEKAAAKYQVALRQLAREAAEDLPPSR